jgi:formylglycine-generating enzyme required for sulfatase activity
MKPRTPSSQSIGTVRAIVAMACLFVTAANLGHGQSAAPTAAPATASVPPSTTSPIPAPPLTDAQKAVLKGKLGDFVSQFVTETGIKLLPIPAGTFLMGSPPGEADRQEIETQHQVTLTQGFWLGATDVTQAQWTTVMGTNPSHFKGETLPVLAAFWDNAMAFCQKLTERERAAGHLPEGYAFTLPTEAQWEYACRAGTTGAYAGDLDAMAWYAKNSGGTTHPVGTKEPNTWGLFDMHGNVWEWCADWYGSYPGGSATDPTGPASGSLRVLRGGSWNFDAASCRSALRYNFEPSFRFSSVGFRVALGAVR